MFNSLDLRLNVVQRVLLQFLLTLTSSECTLLELLSVLFYIYGAIASQQMFVKLYVRLHTEFYLSTQKLVDYGKYYFNPLQSTP